MMLASRLGRPLIGLSLALAAVGCGDNIVVDMASPEDLTNPGLPPDMTKLPDLVVIPDLEVRDMAPFPDLSTPDFAMIPPDLFDPNDYKLPPDFAPPSDFTIPPDFVPPPDLYGVDLNPGRQPYKYVWNGVILPAQRNDYSFDLNGDGVKDNALADLVVNLKLFGIDMQANVSDGVANGSDIKLLRVDTDDPLFVRDLMAGILFRQGMARPNPDFSGNGNFAPDNQLNPANPPYVGILQNQSYFAVSPTALQTPTDVTLKFTFFGQNTSSVTLHGTHISFDFGFDQKSGAPGLVNGQLQGSIQILQVKNILAKEILAAFNAVVMNNGQSKMLILQTFDVGMCQNANGSQAAVNNVVDECELLGSQLFQTLLAPDVTIYDQMGNYRPDPQNGNPDSWSVGIGFNAVKGNYN